MDRLVRWYLKRSYKAMVINYTANGCIPIAEQNMASVSLWR